MVHTVFKRARYAKTECESYHYCSLRTKEVGPWKEILPNWEMSAETRLHIQITFSLPSTSCLLKLTIYGHWLQLPNPGDYWNKEIPHKIPAEFKWICRLKEAMVKWLALFLIFIMIFQRDKVEVHKHGKKGTVPIFSQRNFFSLKTALFTNCISLQRDCYCNIAIEVIGRLSKWFTKFS